VKNQRKKCNKQKTKTKNNEERLVMKILYVKANPKPEEASFSLQVGRALVDALKEAAPQAQVIELDLYQQPVPEIDADVLSAWGSLQGGQPFTALTPEQQAKVGGMTEALEHFLAADRIIFATPMWNFGFPPRFKAYIDAIVAAGRTFKYTEQGPVGLVSGKKAIHVHASGGKHSDTTYRFTVDQLNGVLGFIGVTDLETIWVEGVATVGPEQAEDIKNQAIAKAVSLVDSFLAESITV
jgi:FMN-dependent NADH-azoreductase